MDTGSLWVVEVIGPALLLIVLIWLVMRARSNAAAKRNDTTAERGTRNVYRQEEARRREGTDDL
jgi:hypothetical protein